MVGMGFVVMGFIGYFVKLIHIPINNIVSSQATGSNAEMEAPGGRPCSTMLTLPHDVARPPPSLQLVGGA